MSSTKEKIAPARKQTPTKPSTAEAPGEEISTADYLMLDAYDEVTAVHLACEAVPVSHVDDFSELVDSIERDGVLEPIKINSNGVLLDGRSRLAACMTINCDLRFEVTDVDPWEIARRNFAGRRLPTGQRAAFAAELLEHELKASIRQTPAGKDVGQNPDERRRAAERICEEVGISLSSLLKFQELPDRLKKKVKWGSKTLEEAYNKLCKKSAAKKQKKQKAAPCTRRSLPDGVEVG